MEQEQDANAVFVLLQELQNQTLETFRQAGCFSKPSTVSSRVVWNLVYELADINPVHWLKDVKKIRLCGSLREQIHQKSEELLALIQNPHLSLYVRLIFSFLRIPYIRLCLSHSDTHQKACKLFNLMVFTGCKMGAKNKGADEKTFRRMLVTVNTILLQFENNAEVFSQAYDEFYQYLKIFDQHVTLLKNRLREVEVGRVENDKANRMSQEIIHKSVVGYTQLPMPIKALLEDLWVRVLSYTHLSNGVESEEWKEQRLFVARIVRHYSSTSAMTNVSAFKKDFESLWEIFTHYAINASIDMFKIKCAQQDLRSNHLKLLDEIERKRNSRKSSPAANVEICLATHPEYTAANVMEPGYDLSEGAMMTWASFDHEIHASLVFTSSIESTRMIEQAREGDWWIILLGEVTAQPVQVLYRNEIDKAIVFVNHLGQRVCQKTNSELAMAIDNGNLFKLIIFEDLEAAKRYCDHHQQAVELKFQSELKALMRRSKKTFS